MTFSNPPPPLKYGKFHTFFFFEREGFKKKREREREIIIIFLFNFYQMKDICWKLMMSIKKLPGIQGLLVKPIPISKSHAVCLKKLISTFAIWLKVTITRLLRRSTHKEIFKKIFIYKDNTPAHILLLIN